MIVLVVVLRRLLPEYRPTHVSGYRELLVSTLKLPRELPVLRWRALNQACMFGAFTVVLDRDRLRAGRRAPPQPGRRSGSSPSSARPVRRPPRSPDGSPTAATAGRPAARRSRLAAAALVLAALGASSIVLLALAGVLLDLAVQCHQVMSQQEIYALRGEARARINTVYMTTVFVGGAIASAVAGRLALRVRLDGHVLVRCRAAASSD